MVDTTPIEDEDLIESIANALFRSLNGGHRSFYRAPLSVRTICRSQARIALAVARPVIEAQMGGGSLDGTALTLLDLPARIAAAKREGAREALESALERAKLYVIIGSSMDDGDASALFSCRVLAIETAIADLKNEDEARPPATALVGGHLPQ